MNFTKASDTVLGKYECTADFIYLLTTLHNEMQAHVDQGNYISKEFALFREKHAQPRS